MPGAGGTEDKHKRQAPSLCVNAVFLPKLVHSGTKVEHIIAYIYLYTILEYNIKVLLLVFTCE